MDLYRSRVSLKGWCLGLLSILTALTVLTAWSSPAWAIPAFARKYDLPCSVCHVPSFPKLNDFGNIFRDHGYQLGSDQELPTFEGLTKGYWPVSFRTTVGYQSSSLKNAGAAGGNNVNTATGSFGFTGLDVLSFGILARDISYAIVYTPGLASAGFYAAPTNNDSDLESAWVKLDNLFHSNYFLNLKVGKYELDLPVSEKRLPTLNTNIVMYHYNAGTPYLAGLTENGFVFGNPNSFAIGENQPGLEVFGIKDTPGGGYFRYSLNALSNSNITGPNTGGGRGVNFYGHVTQSIGGYGVVSGQRVGVFGAYGDAPTVDNPGCPAAGTCGPISGGGQPFYRVGVDASLTALNQFNLILAGMRALDSKDLLLTTVGPTAQDAVWYGGFAELDYNPS